MIETAFLPHLFLTIAGGAILAAGRILPRAAVWGPAAFLCLFIAAWLFSVEFDTRTRSESPSNGSPRTTQPASRAVPFQKTTTAFGLLLGGVLCLGLWHAHEITELSAETHGLVLIAVAAALLTVAADNLWLAAAGLELAGLTAVGLRCATSPTGSRVSVAKQAIALHAAATVLLCLAIGMLIAKFETSQLSAMHAQRLSVETGEAPLTVQIAFVLLFAAISIRLALVPFHFGRPDLEARSSSEASFAAAALPTLAAFVFLFRVGFEGLPGLESTATAVALVLCGGTMILGPAFAIAQQNIRATLCYLGIGYAGTILFGLALSWGQSHAAALPSPGVTPMTRGEVAWGLFLLTGLISIAGLHAMLIFLNTSSQNRARPTVTLQRAEYVDQLQGLYRNRPLVAIAIIVFLLNLVGVPPLPGFWGRWTALLATFSIQRVGNSAASPHWGLVIAAGLMLLQSVLIAVVAFRWISAMVFEPSLSPQLPKSRLGALYAGLICLVLTILIGLSPTRTQRQLDVMLGVSRKLTAELHPRL